MLEIYYRFLPLYKPDGDDEHPSRARQSASSSAALKLPRQETWQPSGVVPNTSRLTIEGGHCLPLRASQIDVTIDGFRARITLDLYFENDRDRALEGTFQLRLPNEASLESFAFGPTTFLAGHDSSGAVDSGQAASPSASLVQLAVAQGDPEQLRRLSRPTVVAAESGPAGPEAEGPGRLPSGHAAGRRSGPGPVERGRRVQLPRLSPASRGTAPHRRRLRRRSCRASATTLNCRSICPRPASRRPPIFASPGKWPKRRRSSRRAGGPSRAATFAIISPGGNRRPYGSASTSPARWPSWGAIRPRPRTSPPAGVPICPPMESRPGRPGPSSWSIPR